MLATLLNRPSSRCAWSGVCVAARVSARRRYVVRHARGLRRMHIRETSFWYMPRNWWRTTSSDVSRVTRPSERCCLRFAPGESSEIRVVQNRQEWLYRRSYGVRHDWDRLCVIFGIHSSLLPTKLVKFIKFAPMKPEIILPTPLNRECLHRHSRSVPCCRCRYDSTI